MNPGDRYGKLTAIRFERNGSHKNKFWLFRCDCGQECIKRVGDVTSGRTTSCGCIRSAVARTSHMKHGEFIDNNHHKLYWIWVAMKQRCENPNNKRFDRYGGRGIKVCPEWREDFAAFRDWAMASGYNDTLSIDRIDNDKGYSPDNCRWADAITQRHNQARNTQRGETTWRATTTMT